MLFAIISILSLILSFIICGIFLIKKEFTLALMFFSFLLILLNFWLWLNYLTKFHPA